MRKEILATIEFIKFNSFKEKVELTKKYNGCKMEVIDDHLYVIKLKGLDDSKERHIESDFI